MRFALIAALLAARCAAAPALTTIQTFYTKRMTPDPEGSLRSSGTVSQAADGTRKRPSRALASALSRAIFA